MALISAHFTWKEMLWLPRWNRLATVADGVTKEILDNLTDTAERLELVRTRFRNRPIIIHCAYRPLKYNEEVGGAKHSAHLEGLAVDFHIRGVDCDTVRRILVPLLEDYDIRMEDNPGSNWVHIDLRDSQPRYFKP